MAGIDSYVVLMLHCDGADASTTFTDSSTAQAAKTVTAIGNAQVDTAQSVFGGASLLCDGTGDWLSTPYSADFDLGASGPGNDLTIDFRIRWTSTANSYIIGYSDGTNAWVIEHYAGTVYLGVGTSTVSWSPSVDTWYHVAVVRSGTTITLYIDGTSVGNFSADVDMSMDSQVLYIGSRKDTTRSLNGWMDEIRISKGIARWTSNFTPDSSAYSATSSVRLLALLGVG